MRPAPTCDPEVHLPGVVGDFIGVVGNAGYALTLLKLARPMGRALPDGRRSDHSTFWDVGYDAVMVTDTLFRRNPHDHRMSNTIDTLDVPLLAAVTKGLDAALRGL